MTIIDTIVKGDPSLGFAVLPDTWMAAGMDPLRLPDRDAAEPSTCLSSPNQPPYSCFNDID